MGIDFKLILTLSLFSLFSFNKCSPIEPNSDKQINTEKTMTTQSIDSTITSTTKQKIITNQTTVQTTVQSVAEGQQRFARHQTEGPKEAPTQMTHSKEEPQTSDQNVHEIRVKPEDQSKIGDKNDETNEGLNTSATSTGRYGKSFLYKYQYLENYLIKITYQLIIFSAYPEPKLSLIRKMFDYLKTKLMEIFFYLLSLTTELMTSESNDTIISAKDE